MPFLLFIIFVILSLTLMHRIRYVKQQEAKQGSKFWQQESHADNIRKQDISQLNYIYIPIEMLPFGVDTSKEVVSLEDTIRRLDNTKILNLNQYTNTELKIQYGAANLPFLSECDERYTILVRTLYQWACKLLDHGFTTEAIQIAEYSIDIGSDLSGIYYMLADYYKLFADENALQELSKSAQALTCMNAPQIQEYVINALSELNSETRSDSEITFNSEANPDLKRAP